MISLFNLIARSKSRDFVDDMIRILGKGVNQFGKLAQSRRFRSAVLQCRQCMMPRTIRFDIDGIYIHDLSSTMDFSWINRPPNHHNLPQPVAGQASCRERAGAAHTIICLHMLGCLERTCRGGQAEPHKTTI
jgi:hypothetical protein